MAARIYTGTGPSLSTESEFSVGNIYKMLQGHAANKLAQSEFLLKKARIDYVKETEAKTQRSITRLGNISSGFDWNVSANDPTDMFSGSLPSMGDQWDTYSKGQRADGLGANPGIFVNQYNASAIRNLNMQIGRFEALKSAKYAEQPNWRCFL